MKIKNIKIEDYTLKERLEEIIYMANDLKTYAEGYDFLRTKILNLISDIK